MLSFFFRKLYHGNQESGNLSTTNDYNNLGDLIYYDDDDGGGGGGGEKSKIMKPLIQTVSY
jgi:hypothetical protein